MPAAVDEPVVPLSTRGRLIRVVAAVLVLLVITAGTVRGSDDDFPFGPLRMYATRDNPNGLISVVVVQAVDINGRVIDVTNLSGAPRRAELEGQFSALQAEPTLFYPVAERYLHDGDRLRGGTTRIDQIRLVLREYPLHNGRVTSPVDRRVSTWNVPR